MVSKSGLWTMEVGWMGWMGDYQVRREYCDFVKTAGNS